MKSISEKLEIIADTINENNGIISFKTYKNYYKYYSYVLALNINDEFNRYLEYCINDIMNKHYHYNAYIRSQKLQKINKENDITN